MPEMKFDTPEAAEAAFYQAFDATDLDLMDAVWADGDTVLCIHPGSKVLRGKAAVMRSWMEIFAGSTRPAVDYRFIADFANANLAARLVEERIGQRDNPQLDATSILATNLFLCDGGRWRMVEHHGSLPLMDFGKSGAKEQRLH